MIVCGASVTSASRYLCIVLINCQIGCLFFLFINNRMIELSAANKSYLDFQNYRDGVKRRLRRFGRQG